VLFQFGEFALDDRRLTLAGPAGPIHVEPQVFKLLHHLILNRDRVVSKEELLDGIWGSRFVSESALTSRIKAARAAVGDDGRAQRVIKTVHGRGYHFDAEVHTAGPAARLALPRLRNTPLGRDEDIEDIIALVRRAPLVTITGSGGVGKTTVALAVADRMQSELDDGAVFVDLAPIAADADLTRAVAGAAGVEGAASGSIESVADHLADRPVLLVIDNCEHVLERVAELVDRMLEHGDAARLLATSREPLAVDGEHLWPLAPLTDAGPRLFVERASAAEPRVHWDPDDPAVIELCDRLDNVPLALELAAGQLRRFDLDELRRRIGGRLTLLERRGQGSSQRQATMEATIDWSYRLLDPEEQRLLRHLSTFPSSFDLAAVEASAPAPPNTGLAPLFGQLVDKSLVVREPGSRRYRLLETIRIFARTHLEELGEAPAALERHRHHVRERIGSTSRLERWLSARLAAAYRTDLDDERQALRASIDGGHLEDAVEIAVGASFLWRNAIGCAEGGAWVDELLSRELTDHDRLWVSILRADVGQGRGDHRQMVAAAAAAQQLVARTDDLAAACLARHFGALTHLTAPGGAERHLTAALDLAQQSGDPRLVTLMEAFLVVVAIAARDHDEAGAALQRLDRVASEDGYDRFIVHWAGWMLGLAERDAGAARRWMDRQQDFLDRTGVLETWISSFSFAMCQAVDGGDVRETLERTLALADREGYRADADCVLALAYAEVCADRYDEAAELLGTAVQGRFNATAHYVLYRAVIHPSLRQHLDDGTLGDAMARGRSVPATDALALHGITRPPGRLSSTPG
jgi:predicted ATPase/DNA-binding winged helix-turn-helix (wHTH) protein